MTPRVHRIPLLVALLFIVAMYEFPSSADDWPQYGRDGTRNAVSPEKHPPTSWDIGQPDDSNTLQQIQRTGRNIKWSAKLGSMTYGDPVVVDGMIWVGTNNGVDDSQSKTIDASVLACFRERDGKLLYRYVSPRLPDAFFSDFPSASMACSPLIENDRVWFVTNRAEVVCLDIGPLRRDESEPKVLWKVDMIDKFGVIPRGSMMALGHLCSIAGYKDFIYVITSNGVDWHRKPNINLEAPSIVCFNKETGDTVWKDNSPGQNLLDAQWSSPTIIVVNGRAQCVAPQGDGWVRSFDALTGKPIWQFDLNPKASLKPGRFVRSSIPSSPVFADGRIYIASGSHPSAGLGGPSIVRLVCLDPTKEGDISSELAVDAQGMIILHRKDQFVDIAKEEKVVSNPNSGMAWEYTSVDDAATKIYAMSAIVSNVAVHDGLMIAADYTGLLHCLDARTGQLYWSYDIVASCFASPLIVDDKIYIADEDGYVSVFGLSPDPRIAMRHLNGALKPLHEMSVAEPVYCSPIFADGVLYIAARSRLLAIADLDGSDSKHTGGYWPQWRGPNRDNVSAERDLLQAWPAEGPSLSWRVSGLGQGISPVSVADGRVFALGQYDSTEYVRALDEQTGKSLWIAELGAAQPQSRLMRWLTQRPPTVDGDRLYSVSLSGELVCLSCYDGKLLWKKSYSKEFGGTSGNFGFSDCPVVFRNKLLCTPGGPEASVVALDKTTGKVLWRCAVPDAGGTAYSNGVIATLAGSSQFVAFLGKTLVGIDLENGKLLWRNDDAVNLVSHPHTPLISGNIITCIHGTMGGRGPSISQLEIGKSENTFTARELYSDKFSRFSRYTDDTIYLADRIYEADSGIFTCFDLTSTTMRWRNRLGELATITYADGRFYFHESDGKVRLVEIGADVPIVKSEFKLPEHFDSLGTTTPIVTGGHLYIREDDRLFRYDIRQASSVDSRAEPSREVKLPGPSEKQDRLARDRTLRSVFVPTPQDVVEKMLELVNVQPQDLVFDLGSGDGRIVITAAKKYGCRAIGYEIDQQLVNLATSKVAEANVSSLVKIEQADLFTAKLNEASVIAVYLLPEQLEKLLLQLETLPAGKRIVSHYFKIPGYIPAQSIEMYSREDGNKHDLHLYTTPLAKDAIVLPIKD